MQLWQSPSDAVVKCKRNKLHLDAHTKLITSALCLVYFVLTKRWAQIRENGRGTENLSEWGDVRIRVTTPVQADVIGERLRLTSCYCSSAQHGTYEIIQLIKTDAFDFSAFLIEFSANQHLSMPNHPVSCPVNAHSSYYIMLMKALCVLFIAPPWLKCPLSTELPILSDLHTPPPFLFFLFFV